MAERRPSLSSVGHQNSPKNVTFWSITRKRLEIWHHDVLRVYRKPPMGSLGGPTIFTPGAPDPQKLLIFDLDLQGQIANFITKWQETFQL